MLTMRSPDPSPAESMPEVVECPSLAWECNTAVVFWAAGPARTSWTSWAASEDVHQTTQDGVFNKRSYHLHLVSGSGKKTWQNGMGFCDDLVPCPQAVLTTKRPEMLVVQGQEAVGFLLPYCLFRRGHRPTPPLCSR